MEATAPTRFERRRRQNRQALLEAAIRLFQERGIRATTVEAICEQADVCARTFFNHFETREHLYRAIAHERVRQAVALFEISEDAPTALQQAIPRLLRTIADYLHARPAYRELVGEMLRVRTDGGSELTRSRPLGRAALRFVQAGLDASGLRTSIPPETLADVLLGTLTTALANWSASESYDLPGELERAADALVLLMSAAQTTEAPSRRRKGGRR